MVSWLRRLYGAGLLKLLDRHLLACLNPPPSLVNHFLRLTRQCLLNQMVRNFVEHLRTELVRVNVHQVDLLDASTILFGIKGL